MEWKEILKHQNMIGLNLGQFTPDLIQIIIIIYFVIGNWLTLLVSQMTRSLPTTWTLKVLADVFVTSLNQREVK